MKYLQPEWNDTLNIHDDLNIGNTISFDLFSWKPEGNIEQYYNIYAKNVIIPDGIVLIPGDGEISFKVGRIWVTVDSSVKIPLDEFFIITKKRRHFHTTPPSNMWSNDGGNRYPVIYYTAESTKQKRHVIFHFDYGYITCITGLYKHATEDNFADKLRMIEGNS